MARIRRAAALFALCVIAAGCAPAEEKSGETDRAEEKTLEIMMHLDDNFNMEDNVFLQELENRLGYQIEIVKAPFNSYNDYLSVAMASDDLPDIIQFNWNGEEMFSSWAEGGLLQPISLEKAENILVNVPEAQLQLMKVGRTNDYYGVPGTTSGDYYGVAIRKDWLDALGLPVPRTLQEYESTLEKFVKNDPDGDFKDNTIGMTSWKLNHYCGVFGSAFQTDYLWNSIHPDMVQVLADKKSGNVVLREQQSGYLPLLDYIADLYEKGLLDKDFETLQNAESRFVQGKIGMIGAYTKDVLTLEKKLKAVERDAELIWALPPCDGEGRVWNFMPLTYGYSGVGSLYGKNSVFAITKDADYELALSFLDTMNTKEMILFSNLGVKGVHYDSYDESRRMITRTKEQSDRAKRELFGVSDTYRKESYAFLYDNQKEADRLNYDWRKGKLLITIPQCYPMSLSRVSADFFKENPFFRETERNSAIAYVTGRMDLEQYKSYLLESGETRKAVLLDLQEKYHKLTE